MITQFIALQFHKRIIPTLWNFGPLAPRQGAGEAPKGEAALLQQQVVLAIEGVDVRVSCTLCCGGGGGGGGGCAGRWVLSRLRGGGGGGRGGGDYF